MSSQSDNHRRELERIASDLLRIADAIEREADANYDAHLDEADRAISEALDSVLYSPNLDYERAERAADADYEAAKRDAMASYDADMLRAEYAYRAAQLAAQAAQLP